MLIPNISDEKLNEYNNSLYNYIKTSGTFFETKYSDCGVKTIRILNFSEEFSHHIKKQLTFVLRDNAENYDATIVIWKEQDIKNLYKRIAPEYNPRNNLRLRVQMLATKQKYDDLQVFSEKYSKNQPILSIDILRGIVTSYNPETKTYFYGVENLDPEEFIKEGHIFVQILNKILKTDNTNLVHGACVGLNNKGILLCARGQRGKSTLAVLSMMKGFEYVSDDYLTLEKAGENLFAYPIYSIITLSPRMYNELYDELEGTRFVSNNARKDKYVINISNFHRSFKTKYPVKVCMFPEIVSDKKPSVKKCTEKEKGRAIVHLVHSTVIQMCDSTDIKTVLKIMNFVKNFDFYKINLCNDIHKNVECLKNFAEKIK